MKGNHPSNPSADFQEKVRRVEYVICVTDGESEEPIKVTDDIKYEAKRLGDMLIIANLN